MATRLAASLDVTVPLVQAAQHAVRGFRSIRWPVEPLFSPDPGCTAEPRVHGSKYHLNPSSWARVAPIPRLRPASTEGEAARIAIAVLMPFHSMTTTDSVESIGGGLAKSPSEVLNPPSSSLKAAGSRVESSRCVSRPLRDVTVPSGKTPENT